MAFFRWCKNCFCALRVKTWTWVDATFSFYTLNGLHYSGNILLLLFAYLCFDFIFHCRDQYSSVFSHDAMIRKKMGDTKSNDHTILQIVCCFHGIFFAYFVCVHYLSILWMLMNNFNSHLNIHLHTNVRLNFIVFIFETVGRRSSAIWWLVEFWMNWTKWLHLKRASLHAQYPHNKTYFFYGKKRLIRNEND